MYDYIISFISIAIFLLFNLKKVIYKKCGNYHIYSKDEIFDKFFGIEIKEVKPVTLKFSMPYIIEERIVITL